MSIWYKIENDAIKIATKTTTRNNRVISGYNLDSNADMLASDGYQKMTEEQEIFYNQGLATVVNNEIIDITTTENYKNEQFSTKKQLKLTEVGQLFESSLNNPVAINDVFVLGSWANTYSNTLTAMKDDLEENGEVSPADIIVLNDKGLLISITVSSVEDFLPYYRAVKNDYRAKITKRNEYLISVQNASSIEELSIIEIEF